MRTPIRVISLFLVLIVSLMVFTIQFSSLSSVTEFQGDHDKIIVLETKVLNLERSLKEVQNGGTALALDDQRRIDVLQSDFRSLKQQMESMDLVSKERIDGLDSKFYAAMVFTIVQLIAVIFLFLKPLLPTRKQDEEESHHKHDTSDGDE